MDIWGRLRIGLWAAAIFALTAGAAAEAQEPALPPGLAPAERPASVAEPALPPGLGGPPKNTGPALPPGLGETAVSEEEGEAKGERSAVPFDLHGFWEARGAIRIQDDAAQSSDAPLGETRLQLKREWELGPARLEFTGDVIGDAALEEGDFDLRRLRLVWSPAPNVDIQAGRQVLTWGTGDMVFINDLFPKDWQSFLIGRDEEYLKAPSDSVRVGWYGGNVNVNVVYTPQFEPDRYITGERLSYWNPLLSRRVGEDMQVRANPPSGWFEDDEFAARVYGTAGKYEWAVYGYSGYWKSPAGQRLSTLQATFPRLNVYGASLRGPVLGGIGNIEAGYYDSRDDSGGSKPLMENSQFRFLLGYERELAKDFTGGVQYYLEHMMDYGAYRNSLPGIIEPKDEDRHVLTTRLTKLLMNQDLTLSLFLFYSPSDQDAYLRPKATYKVTDDWELSLGGNLFIGESDGTFFGQFEDNSNVYASARYSF